jgi:hypothetical protein
MTVGSLVLGAVLILMGCIQIWLRHGPASKAATSEDETLGAERRSQSRETRPSSASYPGAGRIRSGRAWEAWTAILGFLGVALGIVLVVMGVLGK